MAPKSRINSTKNIDILDKSILPNPKREIRICKVDKKAITERNLEAEIEENYNLKIELDNQLMERLNSNIQYGKNIKDSKNSKFKERYKKGVNKIITNLKQVLQI